MGCRLSNFILLAPWEKTTIDGHKVEVAKAKYKPITYRGKVVPQTVDDTPTWLYKIDGRFQGATGSADAARHHATHTIADMKSEMERQTQ